MTSRNRKSRRRTTKHRTTRTVSRRRPFEFGALLRLIQILIAVFLLYITASLFKIGTGVLGSDIQSCILRLAGGGVLLILLHLFYGLICSLMRRQVTSVLSQWFGTFCLYGAVSLFLGMLGRTDFRLNIGLLSPGIVGGVGAAVLPRFIGAVGTMLVGLCLVFLSAFNYGHLSAARVAWFREQCAKIHLPAISLPRFHRKKRVEPEDDEDLDEEEINEPEAPEEEKDEYTEPEYAVADTVVSEEPSEAKDESESLPKVKSASRQKKAALMASVVSAFSLLMGRTPKGEATQPVGVNDSDREEEVEVPETVEETEVSSGEEPYEVDETVLEEEEPVDEEFADEELEIHEEKPVRPRTTVASARREPSRADAGAKAAEERPSISRPRVEVDPSDALRGAEAVEYYAGRAIPAGSFPPPLDLLGPHQDVQEVINDQKARENGEEVISTLSDFGVSAELRRTIIGPTVVQYQIQLAPGIKVSKVSSLGNDIAVALGVPSIRVEAPIPGTSYVGIELPNANRRAVPLRQIIESDVFQNTKLHLPLPLGQTVDGRILISGLEELPHLLIAGTTGSGKSIFVNNCIIAMCYHNTPADLRFIMVDPKRVEMGIYEMLPHILARPIVTAQGAVHALAWAVREMDRRYDACAQIKVRSIASYNQKVLPKDRMPHIVIIVDELADLMMTAQKEVEECIMRLAQMARAVGIHLMLATQRPSVNVLTGTIKANIPARVSFSLPSATDSRTILDATGAQNLLGKGDMLFVSTRHPHPLRIQSPFMDEQTNIRIVEYLRNTFGDPVYVDLDEQGEDKKSNSDAFLEDSRLEEAIKIVLSTGVASSSGLQRQMRVGFTRAARLLDTMETMGIVSTSNGSKPREILVDEGEALEILEQYREGQL